MIYKVILNNRYTKVKEVTICADRVSLCAGSLNFTNHCIDGTCKEIIASFNAEEVIGYFRKDKGSMWS